MISDKSLLINQAQMVGPSTEGCTNNSFYILDSRARPSRFRRKKGYTGATAKHFNKNYKTMPKDF